MHSEKVVKDHIRGFGRQYEWQVPAVNIEQWRDGETVYPVIIVVPANPIIKQGLGSHADTSVSHHCQVRQITCSGQRWEGYSTTAAAPREECWPLEQ